MKRPFEIWALRDNGETLLGSYLSLPKMKAVWKEYKGQETLIAKQNVGGRGIVITDQMPERPQRGLTEFRTAEERDAAIIEQAEYFTIVRFLGVGQYERHERKTREEAIKLGETLSEKVRGNYLIYAVNASGRNAYVQSIIYRK